MGLLSTALSGAGLLFLTHAVYSSYEHSLTHATPSTTSDSLYALPTDIILEVLISTTLLCIGIVLASPSLRPIEWRVWAAQANLDDRRKKGSRAFESQGDGGMAGNPFRFLEEGERKGFVDVVGKRREFAGWVRDGPKGDLVKTG